MNLGFSDFNRDNFNRGRTYAARYSGRFAQPSAPVSTQPNTQPSTQPNAEYTASRNSEAAQVEQARTLELQNNSAPYRFVPIRDTSSFYTAELYEDDPQKFQGIDNSRNKVLELSLMVGALFLFF